LNTLAPTAGSNVAATSPPGDIVEVIRVFDGDSLIVAMDGVEAEIRMLGINAPEGDECHGDAARETLEQLLGSGELTLVAGGEDTDQFNRLLRYLYVDGLNVNLALIANGDAIALQGDHPLDDEFTTIADVTAEAGLGMWAADACGSTPPSGAVEIVDYVYNPAGRDEDNMDEEWIALANTGASAVDLSNWILRDESTQNRFRFPPGFGLDPGSEVLVHSGCGSDTENDLFWCAENPVWSNGGDTVILQTADGTVVDRDRFAGEY
jgi:endonuclease YncB( thermonuclease family)